MHSYLLQLFHQPSISNLHLELLRLLALGSVPILLAIPMHLLAFTTAVAVVSTTLAELPIRAIQGSAASGAFLAKSAEPFFRSNHQIYTRNLFLRAFATSIKALACHRKKELHNCEPLEVIGVHHGPIG